MPVDPAEDVTAAGFGAVLDTPLVGGEARIYQPVFFYSQTRHR